MRVHGLIIFLFFSSSVWAAPDGRIRVFIDTEKTIWVGQRVLVHLELKTDGFSFSGQRFELPQISGGVLLQTDSATLKLTEQIEGERWQVLRYDLSFFAQRQGTLEIPSFDVHFNASMGYGQPEASFDLQTEVLKIKANLPPGADPSRPVVTSSQLSINEQWQPDLTEFKVGEALTRKVVINAENVSGITLPAIPDQDVGGIDQLVKVPLVEDKTNRGTLTGFRQEQVSYLFTQEGTYALPGGAFAWWNPQTEILEQYQFEDRKVEVAPDPLVKSSSGSSVKKVRNKPFYAVLIAMLLVILGAVLWRFRLRIKARRATRENTELAQFQRAIKACRNNDARLAWSTTNTWLNNTGLSMQEENESAWQELQRALVLQPDEWSGRALKVGLVNLRKIQRNQAGKVVYLRPLNP